MLGGRKSDEKARYETPNGPPTADGSGRVNRREAPGRRVSAGEDRLR
jgi:hypothetical protein